ncbi:MAG: hypothetical protein AAFZ15_06290 [Bacteroidota bacterium]
MKKTPTHLNDAAPLGKSKLWISLILIFTFLVQNKSISQCQLTCNNSVQASLDDHCQNVITWDALLEGTPAAACISELKVEVFGLNGVLLPTSPIVTGNEINLTLTGKVIHEPSGQSCQANIFVEDKLPPKLFCVDTLISCFHDTMPEKLGFPVFYDNCTANVAISKFDINNSFNCNESDTVLIVNRRWTARDSSGNASVCWQNIYVERPDLDSIDFPANLDNLAAPALYCTSDNTGTEVTGVPMYDSLEIDSICGFFAQYTDTNVPICDGSYTVFRNWKIYDGCDDTIRWQEQTINVMDTLPPDLTCPEDFVVAVANNVCEADAIIPAPATSDSCSGNISVYLEGSFGLISGMTIPGLAMGSYLANCHASDDCGNVSSCQFNITVEDHSPPVAVGISSPTISLLPQGTTYLPATTFDGGSWDNCNGVTVTARRMDHTNCQGDVSTEFGSEVPFYCCDAGQSVEIELRAVDVSGNSSTVVIMANVDDNVDPEITCPVDLTIDCSDDYNDFNLTGQPSVEENCSGFTVSSVDSLQLDPCGAGVVLRHWQVVDIADGKDVCTQKITVDNQSPFYINTNNPNDPNDGVIWPKNYISSTCGDGLLPDELPDEFARPTIFTDDICQMIAVSYSDTWLSQPNNACIEILRNWTIVDWCQFDQFTFEGSWQYGQILRIQNSDDPVITADCQFTEFCSNDEDCQTGSISLECSAKDDCNEESELRYFYEIDYTDDGTTDLAGEGKNVALDAPIGVHRIYWKVEDGCLNTAECDYIFSVTDCFRPTPVCEPIIIEIADNVTPDVQIVAAELDAGSYDNCTSDGDLIFSFSDDSADNSLVFDCSKTGLNEVEIWVTDENGNQDFCTTQIEVQDNNNLCSTASVVSGEIITDVGDPVNDVQVFLNSATSFDSVSTGIPGIYIFNDVETGNDYTVTPSKNSNHINGVTTFDLVIISRHILGIKLLDSPYKIIAADANKSKTVTTFDMVQIRKLILNVDTVFPNNSSWRFINKNYQFPNPQKPFMEAFPEVANINNLSDDMMADFIAVKVGDVNDSADVTE